MNAKQLIWIIPLSLFIGWTIGFYLGIPKHITIDTGDNLNYLVAASENISRNYADACHNLTYECKCDTYDMSEVNKKFGAILSYQVAQKDITCETNTYTYMCLHRDYVNLINDDFCKEVYEYYGNKIS